MSNVSAGNWQYFGPATDAAKAEAESIYPVAGDADFPSGCEHAEFDGEHGAGLYARHLPFSR